MPIISDSTFHPPFWLKDPFYATILPAMLRRPAKLHYTRKRISTRDGDFLDLDFVFKGSDRLAILSHGLEGNSDRYYMRGMAHYFLNKGWDTLSWNCRSCSGQMNLMPRLYHHGASEDLGEVVMQSMTLGYRHIVLIGFSLGGSLVVKYLGENGNEIPEEVAGGVAFSIPCQLGSCAKEMTAPHNSFFLRRFLKKLKAKIKLKAEQFPGLFDISDLDSIRNFDEFDERYTIGMYGFESLEAFYKYASAANYIGGIAKPCLLVNSLDDPMFPDDCYPYDLARDHPYFYLETPQKGGHLGYWWPGRKYSWAENRACEFVRDVIGLR